MLPLVDGDIKKALCGAEEGVCITFRGALEGQEPDSAVLAYYEWGNDPYKLAEDAVAAVSQKLGGFQMRKNKTKPDFLKYLGWCTWDAFYDYLNDAKLKTAKFPNGLKSLIELAKSKYGLKKFVVWHCFQ